MSIGFLEATKILEESNSFCTKNFVLASSGQTEKLDVFIKAISIQNEFNSDYSILPFGVFQQYIATDNDFLEKQHVFIIFPWDLVPVSDWRSAVCLDEVDLDALLEDAIKIKNRLSRFKRKIIYVPAKIPPISLNNSALSILLKKLEILMLEDGASILDSDVFSLSSYLANGCPFSGKRLAEVSQSVVNALLPFHSIKKKVLITDFDNVMWKGVIGEDGIDGIRCFNEGAGFVHYIYQSYLLKLKRAGVLVAGVTRNDEVLAKEPFLHNMTLLNEDDFVAIIASYNAKSSQINALLRKLNLTAESVVFVDDNPLEIEEVKLRSPDVDCVLFPKKNSDFISFMNELVSYFDIKEITKEDKNRTDFYLSRDLYVPPSYEDGADLYEYLLSLEMKVNVTECDKDTMIRPLQLINKTNQFNLNGERLSEDNLISLMNEGGKLFSFSLNDKYADHGQVLCLLLNKEGVVTHFVMSCRVFQRRLEHCCLLWLVAHLGVNHLELNYVKTKHNSPCFLFLDNEAFLINDKVLMNVNKFKNLNMHLSELIMISSVE